MEQKPLMLPQAEAIKKLADQYSRTRLTPFVKKLFTMWLTWQRS